jgi:tetratricopeptide (TPR) repeat protein
VGFFYKEKKLRFYFHITVFIFCAIVVPAQNGNVSRMKKIDSLKTALSETQYDTTKIRIHNWISMLYNNAGKKDLAIESGNKALEIANSIKFNKGIAAAHYNLGNAYRSKDEYKKALEHYTVSLSIREQIGDPALIASVCGQMGGNFRLMGDLYLAKNFQIRALKIREQLKDTINIATALSSLGSIYFDQGNYTEALNYFVRAMKVFEHSAGYEKEIAGIYNNIANIYMVMKKFKESLEYYQLALALNEKMLNTKYKAINLANIGKVHALMGENEEALVYYDRSLKLREELDDKPGMAATLISIAAVSEAQEKMEKALLFAERSLKIRESIGDKAGIASCAKTIGLIMAKTFQFNKALEYLNRSMAISKEIGSNATLTEDYKHLRFVYEEMKDYKRALQFHKLYAALKDTMLNAQNSSEMNLLGTQFESERKDHEIQLLNSEKEKQEAINSAEKKRSRLVLSGVGIVLLFVIIFSFFMYRAFVAKKKDNVRIRIQKEIIEHKNKEVADSITYARRIQNAHLPSEKFMERTLNKMQRR